MAKRHEIGIGALVEPFPPLHELGPEVAEMGDRAAEGREAEPEEGKEDLPGARPELVGRGGCDGHELQDIYCPPFTESVEPVMKPPLSPAR